MATGIKFSAILLFSMAISFMNLGALFSENVPALSTISASPAVLPGLAPNISTFFPSPSTQSPPDVAQAPAPAPSSGEFVGVKSLSSSPNFASELAVFGMSISCFFSLVL
nr:TPA_asm: hypothetical protein HUJ06_004753 [Nelumbo nucifera]